MQIKLNIFMITRNKNGEQNPTATASCQIFQNVSRNNITTQKRDP